MVYLSVTALGPDFVYCGHNRTFPGVGLVPACAGVAVGCGNFLCPAHFRSFPSVASIQAVGRLFSGAWYGGVETCPYVAGTRFGSWRPWGRILFFADTTGYIRTLGSRLCGSGGWVRKFLVSRSFPLISERCLHSGGGRLFAGTWYGGVETCPYVAGTRFGSWRPWGRILFFADTTGHIRTLGSRLCGSGGWVRKFLVSRSFPLISERCLHSGGGRLFAGAWDGGVETCSCKAGTRLGSCRPWGRILFLAGTTRLIRTSGLVSACAGVAIWCGNFFIPAYFRSFPSVASIQAGAGCSLGPGAEVGLNPAPTCLGHGWVAVGLGFGFCFSRAQPDLYGHQGWFLPVREWRFGAEFFYSRLFPLISERCIHSGGGRLFVGTWCRGGSESRPYLPGTRLGG